MRWCSFLRPVSKKKCPVLYDCSYSIVIKAGITERFWGGGDVSLDVSDYRTVGLPRETTAVQADVAESRSRTNANGGDSPGWVREKLKFYPFYVLFVIDSTRPKSFRT